MKFFEGQDQTNVSKHKVLKKVTLKNFLSGLRTIIKNIPN